VAVRARTNRTVSTRSVAPGTTVGLAPIAYNLGVALGWKRFAIASDLSRVDLASQPGGREAADVAVSYTGTRFSGRVKAAADRPLADTPRAVTVLPSYSVDLGGAYSLTRNLDVTAGVRYRSDRDRLTRTDDRRDSQAVYVGTAFRF
jgi:outer membrane receptor for monomeric catechols